MDENKLLKNSVNKIHTNRIHNQIDNLSSSLLKSKELIDEPVELDISPENLKIIKNGERSNIIQNNEGVYFLQNNSTGQIFHPEQDLDSIIKKWLENNIG